MIEARLLELTIKGDRLDEINAEEILDRRAAAQMRAEARRLFLHRLGQLLAAKIGRLWQTGGIRTPSTTKQTFAG
jgi:hypothetical protein